MTLLALSSPASSNSGQKTQSVFAPLPDEIGQEYNSDTEYEELNLSQRLGGPTKFPLRLLSNDKNDYINDQIND